MNELRAAANININWITDFIKYIDVSEKSAEVYLRQLKQFFAYLSNQEIKQPTRQDIINYKDYIRESHKPTTAQNYLSVVKVFFKWTAEVGIYSNIAENVKGFNKEMKTTFKKRNLTAEETANILSEVSEQAIDEKGIRDYAIFLLAVTCGMRTIEIVRANIEDLTAAGNKTILYVQGKGRIDKTEYINIPAYAEHTIRRYLAIRQHTENTAPLFTSTSNHNANKSLTTRSVSRIIKDILTKTGYKDDRLTAHSLRHTAVTLSLLEGEQLQNVKDFARHTNINTTMIYNHSIELTNNTCSQTVEDAIFKHLNPKKAIIKIKSPSGGRDLNRRRKGSSTK